MLRALFPDTVLHPEDLLLLEAFQIKYLPERVPSNEFATLIRAYPVVQRFMVVKSPSIAPFIEKILKETELVEDPVLVEEHCQETLWEIADLIVYNKQPGLYDSTTKISWKIDELTAITPLEGKVVADVGAGSGRIAFQVIPFAKTVYAVEPIASFRTYMMEKASLEKIGNLYVMDGTLNSLPFPDQTLDVLITSNAIGWNLLEELKEIERVVKPAGYAIHLFFSDTKQDNPFHNILVSSSWNYKFLQGDAKNDMKLRYVKKMESI